MKTRLYFLDNLRTFLIFLVVLIHCGIVYEAILEKSWIVVDPQKNDAIGLVRMYVDIFVMFTLFFISGYFIPKSLKSKTSIEFLKSKFNRILLPWIVAVLLFIPLYKFIFLFSRGLPQEDWYSYFHIFNRPGGDPYFFADNPVQNWLWFLPVLFFFQMLYLLLYKVGWLSQKLSIKKALVWTIFISLVYSMSISSLNLTGWYHSAIFHFQNERLLVYFLVFLLGSLCYTHRVFESEIKNKKLYIWTNIVLTVSLGIFTVVALNLFFNLVDPARNYFFVSAGVDKLVYYFTLMISMFSFVYILSYTFNAYFNKTNRILAQLSKNSYYVYILHVVILGAIAIPMMQLSIPAFAKYLLLTILTFIVSNGIVQLYRQSIQKSLSNTYVTAMVLIFASVLAAMVHSKQSTLLASYVESSKKVYSAAAPGIGLHEAAMTGNLDVILKHVEAGSNLNEIEQTGGSSPLITAALFGHTEVAQALIDGGADVDFRNKEGSTSLITASFFGRVEIVNALLESGADKDIKNKDGGTALESVSGPFDGVRTVYDYFVQLYGDMGLELDYVELEKARLEIKEMLEQ